MKKWLSYLLQSLFAITLFLGYSITVNAASYTADNYSATLYDNVDGSLTGVTTYEETSGDHFYYGSIGLIAYSSGGAWGISSPIPLIANHTYSMTVDPYAPGCGFTVLSTVNRIGVGTSLANAVTSYQNNTNVTEEFSNAVSSSQYLQYVFTPTINSSYIVFPFSTTLSCSLATVELHTVVIEDLGISGVTQDEINTSLNSQTTEIQSSINNSTNTITGAITDTEENITNSITETEDNINQNIDDMEDAIVDSNNQTQEVIKDQFNTCRDSYNLLPQPYTLLQGTTEKNGLTIVVNEDYSITITGTTTATTYINLTFNKTFFTNTIYASDTNRCSNGYCLTKGFTYDSNNGMIYLTFSSGKTVNETYYPMITTEENQNTSYELYGQEICSNKLDEANETSKGIWETLKSIPSLILDGIKGLFVPSEDELQSLIDEFKSTMETKLGAVYQVTDMLIDVFKSIFSPTERNSCITFPEIKDPMFDKLLIEETDYCFDTLRTDFAFLFTISDMIISIVCTLAFGNMLYKKFEGFIGGDTSDY